MDMTKHQNEKPAIGEGSDDSASVTGAQPLFDQVLRKRYNFTTLITMFLCVSAGWECIVSNLFQSLVTGGPTALVWGFFISATASQAMAFSLAELARQVVFPSMMPTVAGQYHWAMGWYSAWILVFMTAVASVTATLIVGMQIQSMAVIAYPNTYDPERWHVFAILALTQFIALTINVFRPRMLHYLSIMATVLHFLGFFLITVILLVMTKEKNSAKMVFATPLNNSGWKSDGLTFLIGILPTTAAFMSIDNPARFTEETEFPLMDVPRAMVWGVAGGSFLTFPFILVIAFCMGEPQDLLKSPIVHLNPLAQIIINSTGSEAAAMGLCSIIVVIAFVVAVDQTAAISRLIMAQARDGGIPFNEIFSRVSPRWNVPIPALIFSAIIQLVFGSIYTANQVAYFGISSGTITLQALSYCIPVALHIWARNKHGMSYGPWNMGRWSRVVNMYAVGSYAFLFIIMCFPQQFPVNTMNM
ncbi:hypothetical protein BFJ63_vAg15088 [Fusarium oxysporum f. sp. narcissi]|nr:hypothetical protein BFJ63_vAg15088 [Fusarium oxysporum f. sp. narcissi]